MKTFLATVHQGKIELLEPTELSEGTKVLITLFPDKKADFYLQASQVSLDVIWDNVEDDIYSQLL